VIGDGDGDAVAATECTNPTPFVEGEDTGFFQCDEGFVQRTERVACPSVLPRDTQVEVPDFGWGGEPFMANECESDADCGDKQYCFLWPGSELAPYTECRDSCVTDVDCEDGYLCMCGDEFGTCQVGSRDAQEGGCNTDHDCPDGEMCAGVYLPGICGPGNYEFVCTPVAEGCFKDDCFYTCGSGTGPISCRSDAVCGRPFLVEAEDRKAELMCRGDWCFDAEGTSGDDLSDQAQRQVAAAYFEKIALMEHASIAAFARFQLQLLSLGAPAKFIEATNDALVDETKHARLAFSLAGRFGGAEVGPGALDVGHALEDDSAEAILTTTILEGCVGETMAALEARAALVTCEDEQVRAALEEIAADESRHAQFAWQVVQWMLEERPKLRDLAQSVFDEALAERPSDFGNSCGAPALGVLGDAELRRVHAEAREKVVRPCAEGMLRTSKVRAEKSRTGQALQAFV
jgi:hypothetical protein